LWINVKLKLQNSDLNVAFKPIASGALV